MTEQTEQVEIFAAHTEQTNTALTGQVEQLSSQVIALTQQLELSAARTQLLAGQIEHYAAQTQQLAGQVEELNAQVTGWQGKPRTWARSCPSSRLALADDLPRPSDPADD